MKITWTNAQKLESRSYQCGHCSKPLASDLGYFGASKDINGFITPCTIYICHHCNQPTFFFGNRIQVPGSLFGGNISNLPTPEIEQLYEEARLCYSVSAFTSAVMCCRKILMNIAVEDGAKEGISFGQYVTFLDENGHIPKNGKPWVDKIRILGNEANHKICPRSQEDAKLILTFTEMLLKVLYEMPGLLGA